MDNLDIHIKKVETAIQNLGIDPAVCRTNTVHKWHLHRGNAQVVLMVRESRTHKGEERMTLVIVSPLVIIPKEEQKRRQLYQFLLTTAHQMITESFSIAKESDGTEVAYISSTYFIGEMTDVEISFMLDSLSYFAHRFSEQLRTEFMTDKKEGEIFPPFELDSPND